MRKHIALPSQEFLLEMFEYEPETGVLKHKVYKNSQVQAGDIAGSLKSDGYLDVTVEGRKYYATRIIWMMMTGQDPGDLYVDHKDRDRSNNRWNNLRLATRPQQMWNRRMPGKGYCFDSQRNKWIVRVLVNGKRLWGGRHDTEELAIEAAQKLRAAHHGEFAGEFAAACG